MKNRSSDNLTEKQENFCQYYLDTGGNASEAYRMAYDTSNMKPAVINTKASELKNDGKITVRIDELRAERRDSSEQQRKEAEAYLMDIVTTDIKDLYYTDPATGEARLRQPNQLSEKTRHAIKSIRGKGDNITYEFHNKIEAIKILASWNGWDAPQQIDVHRSKGTLGEIRIGFGDEDIWQD